MTITWNYDSQGRIIEVDIDGSKYQYSFQGVSSLVQSLTRANASVATYQYDALSRLTQISNEKSDGSVVNRFDYTYAE